MHQEEKSHASSESRSPVIPRFKQESCGQQRSNDSRQGEQETSKIASGDQWGDRGSLRVEQKGQQCEATTSQQHELSCPSHPFVARDGSLVYWRGSTRRPQVLDGRDGRYCSQEKQDQTPGSMRSRTQEC